jgi:hypothetical protein
MSFLIATLGVLAAGGQVLAHPGGITTPDPTLPPEGVYLSPADVHATYGGGALTIVLQAVQHQPFKDLPPRDFCGPIAGCEEHDFDSDLKAKVSINGGSPMDVLMEGRVITRAYDKTSPTQTGVFQTEMISMNLVGMTMMGPVMVREMDGANNPNQPSMGVTEITPLGGGMYHIDSFFDVFTELSIDGGMTWIPSNGPTHVTLYVPEPASLAMVGLALATFAGFARRRK